jgi:hypothetical protein
MAEFQPVYRETPIVRPEGGIVTVPWLQWFQAVQQKISFIGDSQTNSQGMPYTVNAGDAGRFVRATAAGTLTLAPNLPVNMYFFFSNNTAVNCTIARGAGVSLFWQGVDANRTLSGNTGMAILWQEISNVWLTWGFGIT